MFKNTIVLLTLLSLFGCKNYVHKESSYTGYDKVHDKIRVIAELEGEVNIGEKKRTIGSPYSLRFVVRTPEGKAGWPVTIKSIRLTTTSGKEVYRSQDAVNLVMKMWIPADPIFSAIYRIDDLDLEYEDYRLQMEIEVQRDGDVWTHTVDYLFRKDYKEYKTSPTWDRLGSV